MTERIMKKQSNYSCDVLIIGGGSAGLRAAIEAHDAGANVLIIMTTFKLKCSLRLLIFLSSLQGSQVIVSKTFLYYRQPACHLHRIYLERMSLLPAAC